MDGYDALAAWDLVALRDALAAGQDPDEVRDGKTLLGHAISRESLMDVGNPDPPADATTLLLDAGADPFLPPDGGRSAIHVAVAYQHSGAITQIMAGSRAARGAGPLAGRPVVDSILTGLLHELSHRSDADWENLTIAAFLDAFQALLDSIEQVYEHQGQDVPDDPWLIFATVLAGAPYYE